MLTAIPELIINGMNQERRINQEQPIELVFWNTRMSPIMEGMRFDDDVRMPGCGDTVVLRRDPWRIVHTQMHSEMVGVPGRLTPVAAIFICHRV